MPMEVRFEHARKIADHLKVCSCHYSCGNKRYDPWLSKKGRLTKQERIMLSIFQDFYRDWEDDNE